MKKLKKLLVIGSGGREHGLAWKFGQSPDVLKVCVAPGNAGTALEPRLENVPIPLSDPAIYIEKLADFASQNDIACTVVGPEAPLAAGIVNVLRDRGLKIFGPTKEAAQLESSKDFAKRFMVRHKIPTAPYESFTSLTMAHLHVNDRDLPMVIKADGLASGKGAFVCQTLVEAHEAIDKVVALGDAGKIIIVEDFIPGEEASFIVMVDINGHVLPLATSQDHKQLKDGDVGPMTGGMGAVSPAPIITPELHERFMNEIILPTVRGMAKDGIPYTGFLYAGLMIDAQGNAKTLEFNCRHGDPETQPILLRLKSDFAEIVEHAVNGTLDQAHPVWDTRVAVGVVLAAEGYPGKPRTGDEIYGLPEEAEDCKVFHAGTVLEGDKVVVNGGRVLCVTALGEDFEAAQCRAYKTAFKIRFPGKQMRLDIGDRAKNRLATEAG